MAGLKLQVSIENLKNGAVLHKSPSVPVFRSITVRNSSNVAIPVYLDASAPTATPDFVVAPLEYTTQPCDCHEIFFGYVPLGDPPAGGAFFFASDQELAASSGALPLLAGDPSTPPIAGAGNQIQINRITWPGGEKSEKVVYPFPACSVRLWGIAGGAHAFLSLPTLPLLFDANGVPSDPSYIGSVKIGVDTVFHLPAPAASIVLVPSGGNATNAQRLSFGANHLYPLSDGDAVAVDLSGGAAGSYGVFCLLQEQPPIAGDQSFSLEGVRNDPNGGVVSFPWKEANNGHDFSLEIIYKKTVDTSGFNPLVNLFDNRNNGAVATGIQLSDGGAGTGGNQLRLALASSLDAAAFYTGGALAVGSTYAILLVVSASTGSAAVYLNGVQVGMAAGPGAPPLSAFGAYVPGTFTMELGATTNSGLKGYFQSFTSYPSALTSSQIAALYGTLQNSAPEIMVSATDGLWTPSTSSLTPGAAVAAAVQYLAKLKDVSIPAPADRAVLSYVAADNLWEAIALPGGVLSLNALSGALTLSSADSTVAIVSGGANVDLHSASLPLCNGDLPGPGVMADANGQCILVKI